MIRPVRLEDFRSIRLEVAAKHQECAETRRSMDGLLSATIMILQSGRPTSCINGEEVERLLHAYQAAAEDLLQSMEVALEMTEAAVYESERFGIAIGPIAQAAQTLAARAIRARETDDIDEARAIRREFEPLRLEFERHKERFLEYKQMLLEFDPMHEVAVEFRDMHRSIRWKTELDTIIKLISPPFLPTLLLAIVCKPTLRDGTIGDAEETFHNNLDEHGRKWAIALYWADTIRSVGPLLVRFIIRLISAYLLISR